MIYFLIPIGVEMNECFHISYIPYKAPTMYCNWLHASVPKVLLIGLQVLSIKTTSTSMYKHERTPTETNLNTSSFVQTSST